VLGSWPASPDENPYTRVPDSNVETLLIGGNLDFATPPQNATRALLPHLPHGHQVILTGLGHTDDFWAAGSRGLRGLADRVEVAGGSLSVVSPAGGPTRISAEIPVPRAEEAGGRDRSRR
jgi:hypothetical protein